MIKVFYWLKTIRKVFICLCRKYLWIQWNLFIKQISWSTVYYIHSVKSSTEWGVFITPFHKTNILINSFLYSSSEIYHLSLSPRCQLSLHGDRKEGGREREREIRIHDRSVVESYRPENERWWVNNVVVHSSVYFIYCILFFDRIFW